MFTIKESEDKATIYVYGTIGDHWKEDKANRAKDFAAALDDLTPKALDIRIDSPGGDAFEGFAIASAIQRYEGKTHAYVDGMAASAASYIAIMADKVTMNDFSAFMIHNASGIVIGNRDDMRETADLLESLDNSIARTIASRTGMGLEDVKDAMSAETWYFGDEAKNAGLCDEVIKTEKRGKAKISREFADRFKNIPEGVEVIDEADESSELTVNNPSQKYMVTLNDSGITFYPVSGDGTVEHTQEPTQEPTQEGIEDGISHSPSTMCGIEGTGAKGAVLLGNKIYRKEI